MQTVIIGILVIVIPMVAYCVGTVMRDDMYAKDAGEKATDGGKKEKTTQVTKDTRMGDILAMDKDMGDFLLKSGMHCVTCSASVSEPLEAACSVHGIDADKMLANINAYLAEKE
jgi:hybrid cluster-associated redox disulfide protein